MSHRITFGLEGLTTERKSVALQRRLAALPGIRIERVRLGSGDTHGEIALVLDGRRTTEHEVRASLSLDGLSITP